MQSTYRGLARADACPEKETPHQGQGAKRTTDTHKHTGIRTFVKAWIVRLALWGWLPYGLATWLIQRGGLRHD